jgi:hypothetical protein
MPKGPIRLHAVCPNCGEPLRLRDLRDDLCMTCNEPVRVPWAHRRQISYMALLVVVLIGLATYSRASGGPWLIGLVLFWPLIAFVLSAILPPTYERGYAQPQVTFVTTFVTVFVSVLLVEFVAFLGAYVVLRAKPWEVQEHLELLSEPLALLNRQFLITPEKSFSDVWGVMLGNSFLIAIPVFLCAKGVQHILRRNRPTQIGISGSADATDDD